MCIRDRHRDRELDTGLNNPRHNGRILRKIYLIFYNASVFNDFIRKVKDGIRPDCICIQTGIDVYKRQDTGTYSNPSNKLIF